MCFVITSENTRRSARRSAPRRRRTKRCPARSRCGASASFRRTGAAVGRRASRVSRRLFGTVDEPRVADLVVFPTLRAPPKHARGLLGTVGQRPRAGLAGLDGAAAVARDLVCPTCLTDYSPGSLREQWASTAEEEVGVNCSRLGLTELKLDPHHGLSVVAAPLPPSQTLPRPGEDAVCLALLDQAYPLRTAHHLARKHPFLRHACCLRGGAALHLSDEAPGPDGL